MSNPRDPSFDKLSLIAKYDDMCRFVNQFIKESSQEEDKSIKMLEDLERRWNNREAVFTKEKDDLKVEINSLQKEIKKLNRQLAESRTALVRETDEKRTLINEKRALMNQITQVRQLVESKDSFGDSDAHRKRVIKCLDVERLSPIQSDDSADDVSGLDYDRTEEDILDGERSRRNTAFEEVLESLPQNEQPTLLYRFLDQGAEDNKQRDEPRRSSRRSGASQRQSSGHRSKHADVATATSSSRNRVADLAMETDTGSTDTDDNQIEFVRQQLQKLEDEKKERLASHASTPNIRTENRAATLSAKSAANLKRVISNVGTPVPNALKPHSFVTKKTFRPEQCGPCEGRIAFYGDVVKCESCGVVSHPNCKEKCPLPCIKITAPVARSRQRKTLISDYVNKDACPKVPALIVHCCNEIEREGNITQSGLYLVVKKEEDIIKLSNSILKSKSGMPNLSRYEVHLLTGVVTYFLQKLDESLITTTLWSHFHEATKLDSKVETSTHMSYNIRSDLPSANRDTLAFLMQHLHAIAKHADENHMTTKQLAKKFAPLIVGKSSPNSKESTTASETRAQVQIMEALFEIEEEFWAELVPRVSPTQINLGSRLLGTTPSSATKPRTRTSSRLLGTLPTPKLKPLY